jgi:hypothetical protein
MKLDGKKQPMPTSPQVPHIASAGARGLFLGVNEFSE